MARSSKSPCSAASELFRPRPPQEVCSSRRPCLSGERRPQGLSREVAVRLTRRAAARSLRSSGPRGGCTTRAGLPPSAPDTEIVRNDRHVEAPAVSFDFVEVEHDLCWILLASRSRIVCTGSRRLPSSPRSSFAEAWVPFAVRNPRNRNRSPAGGHAIHPSSQYRPAPRARCGRRKAFTRARSKGRKSPCSSARRSFSRSSSRCPP